MATISANEKQWEKSEKARWLLPGKTEPNSVTDSQESIALFRSGSHKDMIEFIREKNMSRSRAGIECIGRVTANELIESCCDNIYQLLHNQLSLS